MSVEAKDVNQSIAKFKAKYSTKGYREGAANAIPGVTLETVWPVIKNIILFLKPVLKINPKWWMYVDMFIALMDARVAGGGGA